MSDRVVDKVVDNCCPKHGEQFTWVMKGDSRVCITDHCGKVLREITFSETDKRNYATVCGLDGIGPTPNINPSYYKGRDVMDIINRYLLSFCLGNVVCYVLRHKQKNGIEDLKKAKWYLEEEIRILEGQLEGEK